MRKRRRRRSPPRSSWAASCLPSNSSAAGIHLRNSGTRGAAGDTHRDAARVLRLRGEVFRRRHALSLSLRSANRTRRGAQITRAARLRRARLPRLGSRGFYGRQQGQGVAHRGQHRARHDGSQLGTDGGPAGGYLIRLIGVAHPGDDGHDMNGAIPMNWFDALPWRRGKARRIPVRSGTKPRVPIAPVTPRWEGAAGVLRGLSIMAAGLVLAGVLGWLWSVLSDPRTALKG